jgi:hypothetical protein
MGQLKSTVECDVCDRVSVTFDPFMYLSVPLPQVTTRSITVTLVRRDGSSPTRYSVTLEKDLNVGALKSGLSALCGIPVNCIVIADVFMSKIHADYEDHVPLTQISARDEIYGYEILSLSKAPPSKPPPEPPVGASDASAADAQQQQPPAPNVPLDESDDDFRNAPTVPTRAQATGVDDDGDDDGYGGSGKRAVPTTTTSSSMKDSFDDFPPPPPPPSRTTEENGNVVVLVYHKHAGLGHGLFGAPLILCFTATPTYLELTRAFYDQIKRTLLPPPSAMSAVAPEYELLPRPPLQQSTDSDSVELTESTERMFPPERLRALAEAAAVLEPTPAGEPEPEPEWMAALEDESFRRVLRHLKLTTQVSTFTDRTLTFGDGGMLDINSRDQVTAHYLGELDARYDPAADRSYPRHESCVPGGANNEAAVCRSPSASTCS